MTDIQKLLVIANETCPCPGLHTEVRSHAALDEAEVLVVAPALNDRLAHWLSDVDEALRRAEARLEAIVSNLAEQGVRVRGEVGDAEPLRAIEDALRGFAADAILLSTHPPGQSHWLEKQLPERATERFDIPVMHYVSAYGAVAAPG